MLMHIVFVIDGIFAKNPQHEPVDSSLDDFDNYDCSCYGWRICRSCRYIRKCRGYKCACRIDDSISAILHFAFSRNDEKLIRICANKSWLTSYKACKTFVSYVTLYGRLDLITTELDIHKIAISAFFESNRDVLEVCLRLDPSFADKIMVIHVKRLARADSMNSCKFLTNASMLLVRAGATNFEKYQKYANRNTMLCFINGLNTKYINEMEKQKIRNKSIGLYFSALTLLLFAYYALIIR